MMHMRGKKKIVKVKTKRPIENAYFQQTIPAWQPTLTTKASIPWLVVIGVIFIPVGVALLKASHDVVDYSYDYTDCYSKDTGKQCSKLRENNTFMSTMDLESCICSVDISLPDMQGDIFVYYGLT